MKLKWVQAPVKTQWGDEMVVASVAIDNHHTLDLYCERDQTAKAAVMFEQREWVELSAEEMVALAKKYRDAPVALIAAVEAKLKEKNT